MKAKRESVSIVRGRLVGVVQVSSEQRVLISGKRMLAIHPDLIVGGGDAGVPHVVSMLSQLFAKKAPLSKVDENMSSEFRFERAQGGAGQDSSTDESIRSEIQELNSSLRGIYDARLRLARGLEENLALHRAIALRQPQSFAPLEQSRSPRTSGRMR